MRKKFEFILLRMMYFIEVLVVFGFVVGGEGVGSY